MEEQPEFLDLARGVGNYVSSLAECVESGFRWRTANYSGASEYSPEVFSGVSGIVLFLADLYVATGDPGFKALAEGGAGWVDAKVRASAEGGIGRYRGLYSGYSGHGLAMLHLGAVTKDDRWLSLAAERADALLGAAYGGVELMYGAAGMGVFLARMYQQTGAGKYLEEATRAGDHILQTAEREGDACKWLIDLGGRANYQMGAAHGAAGIGCLLIDLYRLTGADRFRDAALGAARWLGATAVESDYGVAWKTDPDDPDPPRFQWCHGSPGIGLFFARAHAATKDPLCKDFAIRCGEATFIAGDVRNNPSQCHGLAGNGELFIELERVLGGGAWLEKAKRFGGLVSKYREGAPPIFKWRSDEPGQYSPDFMTGASGTGHFLLRFAKPQVFEMPLMVRNA